MSLTEELFNKCKTCEEIGKVIQRSEWSVSYVLTNMGYSYKSSKYWTEDEIKFLEDNYMNMKYEDIGQILGRTVKAIRAKTEEQGFQKRRKKDE